MSNVTAVIAVLNEEEHLRGCLETLDWCDNILVVDNGSEDDTVSIAREYTDNVHHYKKQHGYVEPVKVHAIQKVTTEWAFVIDGDEMVSKRLADRLQDIVRNNEADVVKIPFKNYLFGRWISATNWWPAAHPRLFRTDSMTLSDDIHSSESIHDDATVLELPMDPDQAIVHFNYTDVEDYLSSTNAYTTIEAEQKPEKFSYINMVKRPIEEFGYQFLKTKGYKIGRYGLLISILTAWYRFQMYLKMWEKQKLGGKEAYEQEYDRVRDDVLREWE